VAVAPPARGTRCRRRTVRLRAVAGAAPSPGSWSAIAPVANAGTTPPCSSITSLRRRRYTGSRSFHSASTGDAMKIDE